jgi:hypothetical protein
MKVSENEGEGVSKDVGVSDGVSRGVDVNEGVGGSESI